MTDKQAKKIARLLAAKLLCDASEDISAVSELDIDVEKLEGRLTMDEQLMIEDAMTDIAQDLTGKDIRFNTTEEIIRYVKKEHTENA